MRKPPERSAGSKQKPAASPIRSLDERRRQKAARVPAAPLAAAKSPRVKPPARKSSVGGLGFGKPKANRPTRQERKELRSSINRFTAASRSRRAIILTLLGSFVALILVVVATLTTPLIAVEKIRITGLHAVSQKQVRKALRDQLGVPLSLINQQHIVDELSSFTRIESVAIVAELPHTLHVAVTERSPIAIVVVNGVAYLYDLAGIRLGVAHSSDMYPLISSAGEPKSSASYKEAIAVLLSLPSKLLSKVASVNASSQDNVTLQLRGYAGQKIIWGDSSRGIFKSRVLAALMANQKQTDRVTYDVSSPDAPVVRWR